MNCTQFNEKIDDYCDGALTAEQVRAMQQHATSCTACASTLKAHQSMLAGLKSLSAPAMRPGYAQQALRRSVAQNTHLRRGFLTGFGSAMAAAAAILVAVVLWMPGGFDQDAPVSRVQLSLHAESNVNLVFFAPGEVDEARLTIILPPNVEVAGFEGQQEIAWTTSLSAGKNILPLPLKALATGDGQLVAHIETGKGKKTFRIRLDAGGKPGIHSLNVPARHA